MGYLFLPGSSDVGLPVSPGFWITWTGEGFATTGDGLADAAEELVGPAFGFAGAGEEAGGA